MTKAKHNTSTVLRASEIQTDAFKENYTYACTPRGFLFVTRRLKL